MILTPYAITLLANACLLIGFVCLCFHEILLGPDNPNYPTAPWYVRAAMFIWLVSLGVLATERFTQMQAGTLTLTASALLANAAFALAQAVLLEQQLRRWLPARLHERIRHLLAIASCRRRPGVSAARASANAALRPGVEKQSGSADVVGAALGALAMDGMRAIGPGEGVEVFNTLPPITGTPRESLGLPPLEARP